MYPTYNLVMECMSFFQIISPKEHILTIKTKHKMNFQEHINEIKDILRAAEDYQWTYDARHG